MTFCNMKEFKTAFSSDCTDTKSFFDAPEARFAGKDSSAPCHTVYIAMDTLAVVSIFVISVLTVLALVSVSAFRLNVQVGGMINIIIAIAAVSIAMIGKIISVHDIEPDFRETCIA